MYVLLDTVATKMCNLSLIQHIPSSGSLPPLILQPHSGTCNPLICLWHCLSTLCTLTTLLIKGKFCNQSSNDLFAYAPVSFCSLPLSLTYSLGKGNFSQTQLSYYLHRHLWNSMWNSMQLERNTGPLTYLTLNSCLLSASEPFICLDNHTHFPHPLTLLLS